MRITRTLGVRRLVRLVAALRIRLVICPSFARIPRQKLTPTSNCTHPVILSLLSHGELSSRRALSSNMTFFCASVKPDSCTFKRADSK